MNQWNQNVRSLLHFCIAKRMRWKVSRQAPGWRERARTNRLRGLLHEPESRCLVRDSEAFGGGCSEGRILMERC